ncbi:P-loop NTPase fold protein [Geothrix sp.]|uniref:KAP family P-loop NTPase fold protein n=1 Tax=Geothrix sp. TaxID=1962974 RepID=UPI0025C30839|nr:P-loop NTPase fold protein [Geothrix sp.]
MKSISRGKPTELRKSPEVEMSGNSVAISFSDSPILSADEDRLHRKPYAHHLAEFLCNNVGKDSLVMAIQGPWGSGKTSLLNLIAEEIGDRTIILRFNPWLFSGSEQLVSQFFVEVSSQLQHGDQAALKKLAEAIAKYGDYFANLTGKIPHGAWFQFVFKVFSFYILSKSNQPASELKRGIEAQFVALEKRVVIFVDDLDRMRDEEIREIVRLVRLVGNFPNVSYVLAYDQSKVASALDSNLDVGRAFLEKIVQVAYEVPRPGQEDLDTLCIDALGACHEMTPHRDLDEKEWPNLWHSIIRPLMKTPRDVRRYTISLPAILNSVADEVALADLLAIEAIRIMLPKSFQHMVMMQDFLTTERQNWRGQPPEASVKMAFDELFATGGEHSEVLREACRRLFPATQAYLGNRHFAAGTYQERERDRRISAPEVFSFYLRHALSDGDIRTHEVEEALRSMGDRDAFSMALRGRGPEGMEKLIVRIEAYEGIYPEKGIEPGVGAIFDCYDQFRQERPGMYQNSGITKATRVIYRLLKQLEPPEERAAAILRIIPTLKWHSAAHELIRLSKGHEFIPEDLEKELLSSLYLRILDESAEHLRGERDLLWLSSAVVQAHPEEKARFLEKFEENPLFFSMLRSGLSQGHRHSGDNLYSEVIHSLPWESFVEIFGEEHLVQRINRLPASESIPNIEPLVATAIDLAKKYATGWRPDDFFGRRQARTAPAVVNEQE